MTAFSDYVTCKHCGEKVRRHRLAQVDCSKPCRDADAMVRLRQRRSANKSANKPEPATSVPGSANTVPAPAPSAQMEASTHTFQAGPTPGALQGDDYQLEYDENGHPELPARSDRRRPTKLEKAA
jgi:hypothetical protein